MARLTRAQRATLQQVLDGVRLDCVYSSDREQLKDALRAVLAELDRLREERRIAVEALRYYEGRDGGHEAMAALVRMRKAARKGRDVQL